MKTVRLKFGDEWRVTKQDVKLSAMVAYVKVTEWSLTTSDHTVLGHWRTYQLGWLLVTRTELGNLLGIK